MWHFHNGLCCGQAVHEESQESSSDFSSYWCSRIRLMPIQSIDPSLAIGFYCRHRGAAPLCPCREDCLVGLALLLLAALDPRSVLLCHQRLLYGKHYDIWMYYQRTRRVHVKVRQNLVVRRSLWPGCMQTGDLKFMSKALWWLAPMLLPPACSALDLAQDGCKQGRLSPSLRAVSSWR